MLPWEMDRLTRFDVFEIYLKPDEEQKKMMIPRRTPREWSFDHWMLGGYCSTWEECERKWQEKQNELAKLKKMTNDSQR